jgi:hypothetical protein
MARPKASEKPVEQKGLTQEEKENIVEEVLGVHPRYFVYQHQTIGINLWNLEHDGKLFNGFIPHLKELGQL